MTKQKTQKTDRLTREQWLARSLEILSDGGPGELRIDNITHKMGISKGSFYWHFKNRADYIECLAKYWDHWSNDAVVERVSTMDSDPVSKMKSLIETVIGANLGAYDAAVQMLVHKEPQIAPIVIQGFMKRYGFLNSLFKQLGFKGKELESRTRLFVGYFLLDAVLIDQESKKKRLEKALDMLDFLTTG
ncbi:MAG: TetR/AcrR family transcriptional regulator [Planctomycetota bacterium]|jgi:AcrR family transcriptional regulator